jgi:hypothetical protein
MQTTDCLTAQLSGTGSSHLRNVDHSCPSLLRIILLVLLLLLLVNLLLTLQDLLHEL